jgi:hypothetical protein
LRYILSIFVLCLLVMSAQAGTWEYDFTQVSGDEWERDWEVISGTFEVVDGALTQTEVSANDNNAFRCLARTGWEIEDGTIEAKVKHSGTGLNDALVYYRMMDNDNGYASRLQLDNYITIGKITNGQHGHIQFVSTPVEADIWYIVKVELEGSNITVFVDDQEFISLEDNFSSQGLVGFGMARCAGGASLEWIRVTGDGVTATAVAPAGKLATTWSGIKIN